MKHYVRSKEDRYKRELRQCPGRAWAKSMKILWFWTLTLLRLPRQVYLRKHFRSVTSTAVSPRAIWQASQPVLPLQERFPSCSTFAMFAAGRAFEQVRNSIGYPHLNVKIGATHAGLSVGEDGATHQCNEDIALMRAIPGMVVINPSDDIEAKAAVKAAYEYVGPVYLRFGRLAAPVINDRPDYKFEIGKGLTLREGKDLTIVATGLMVSESLAAAEMLAKDGIEAKVINIHTIKPLDEDLIVAAAKETGKVVTVEEHSIIGGLGSAVCDCLSEKAPTRVLKIGVNDVYGESGPAKEVLHKYGLDAEGIYTKIKAFA